MWTLLSNVFCRSMKPLTSVNCTKSRKNVTIVAICSQPWHRKLKILSPRTDHDTCSLTTFRVYFSSKKTKQNDKNRTKKRIFVYKILGFQNCDLAENHPYIMSIILLFNTFIWQICIFQSLIIFSNVAHPAIISIWPT